jgi:hypothetical protein
MRVASEPAESPASCESPASRESLELDEAGDIESALKMTMPGSTVSTLSASSISR